MKYSRLTAWWLCLAACLCLLAAAAAGEAPQNAVVVTDARAVVDFDYLQALNPECVGWLYQPSGSFSQPVMYSADSKKYTTRLFDGASAPALQRGCVHVDAAGDPSLTSPFTLLRASMSDTGPFAWLAGYADQAYYQAHPCFRLLTPAGDWQAEVFAYVAARRENMPSITPTGNRQDWLNSLLAMSSLRPDGRALPGEGERLLGLTGLSTANNCVLVLCTLRPIRYATEQTVDLTKWEMDTRKTISGRVSVGSLGERQYYAQNDPLWEKCIFETGARSYLRTFGDGGCGPTVVAMALANLVPAEELPRVGSVAESALGNQFCACTVNRLFCNHTHVPYRLSTPQEYLRYLPVAIADVATGNNIWGVKGRSTKIRGTSMNYAPYLFELFGLQSSRGDSLDEALAVLENNPRAVCIASCTLGSPFTGSSHYVLIVGADDTFFYVLDPLPRESYGEADYLEITEVLSPGVVRLLRRDALHSNVYPTYTLWRAE